MLVLGAAELTFPSCYSSLELSEQPGAVSSQLLPPVSPGTSSAQSVLPENLQTGACLSQEPHWDLCSSCFSLCDAQRLSGIKLLQEQSRHWSLLNGL